jgi:hypothetical protein
MKKFFSAIFFIFSTFAIFAQDTIELAPADSTQSVVTAGWGYEPHKTTKSVNITLDFTKTGLGPVVLTRKQYLQAGKPADNGSKPNALTEALFAADLKVSHVIYHGGTGFTLDFSEDVDGKAIEAEIKEIFAENFRKATVTHGDGHVSK